MPGPLGTDSRSSKIGVEDHEIDGTRQAEFPCSVNPDLTGEKLL